MIMTTAPIIETTNLYKKYDEFIAVNNLNLNVLEGEIFGLLGPNGAGKTTLILMLLGLTEPTSGSCLVNGYDPLKDTIKVKQICGYLPEKLGFYEDISAYHNLKYFAKLNRIPDVEINKRIKEALSIVDLTNQTDNKVKTFSRGMKQRLGIANVLIKKPTIAFFDEPTQGIDPLGINDILELFIRLNKEEGLTILVSSHQLQHIQQICNTIGILVQGRLVKQAAITSIDQEFDENILIEVELLNPDEKVVKEISLIPGVLEVIKYGNILTLECESDLRTEISRHIIKNNIHLLSLGLKRRSLFDVYRKYSEEE